MSEKQATRRSHERLDTHEQLREEHEQHTERLREQLEQAEREHKDKAEQHDILHEAKELADKQDKQSKHSVSPAERRRGPLTKKQLANSFDSQMTHVREHLRPSERIFSKLIHLKPIEATSDFVGSTIARPNALLTGSIVAFLSVTLLYFLANHYGFQLSGFETIAAFVVGWILGIAYDYISVAFRRRNQ